MRAKLKDLTLNRDGSQNLTLTIFEDYREAYDELADKDLEIDIKKISKRRSLEANSFLWSLCDQISKKSSKYSTDGKNEIYRDAIRKKGVWKEVFIREDAAADFIRGWSKHGLGWFADIMDEFSGKDGKVFKQIHVYFGSSIYSANELAPVIDYVVMIANDLGIPTLTPKEEERMLGSWAKRYERKYGKNAS